MQFKDFILQEAPLPPSGGLPPMPPGGMMPPPMPGGAPPMMPPPGGMMPPPGMPPGPGGAANGAPQDTDVVIKPSTIWDVFSKIYLPKKQKD